MKKDVVKRRAFMLVCLIKDAFQFNELRIREKVENEIQEVNSLVHH